MKCKEGVVQNLVMSFLNVTVGVVSRVICDRRQQTLVLGGQPAGPLAYGAVSERPGLQLTLL